MFTASSLQLSIVSTSSVSPTFSGSSADRVFLTLFTNVS